MTAKAKVCRFTEQCLAQIQKQALDPESLNFQGRKQLGTVSAVQQIILLPPHTHMRVCVCVCVCTKKVVHASRTASSMVLAKNQHLAFQLWPSQKRQAKSRKSELLSLQAESLVGHQLVRHLGWRSFGKNSLGSNRKKADKKGALFEVGPPGWVQPGFEQPPRGGG